MSKKSVKIPTGPDHYITDPVVLPEFPRKVEIRPGEFMPTNKALPIARAVLLLGVTVLKEQIPSSKRTIYNLERSCFHLRRVRIAPKEGGENG